MYGTVHLPFMQGRLSLIAGRDPSRMYRGKSMKIVLVTACLAVAAAALSGCVVYVAPDHHITHTPPHSDEKPAPVDEHPAPTA